MPDHATELIDIAVERGATNPPGKSDFHGDEHWRCVALMGLMLARHSFELKASLPFIYVFAQLHDIMRENEYDDPMHGPRAAQLFVAMVDKPGVELFLPYDEDTLALMFAMSHHQDPDCRRSVHDNPNVGLCWDADRLNLWRDNKVPADEYLTTEIARTDAAKLHGRHLCSMMGTGNLPSWDAILEAMTQWRWP